MTGTTTAFLMGGTCRASIISSTSSFFSLSILCWGLQDIKWQNKVLLNLVVVLKVSEDIGCAASGSFIFAPLAGAQTPEYQVVPRKQVAGTLSVPSQLLRALRALPIAWCM